ncbi:dimethylsulfonioproprionate lyase family protein [Defluviimonas sp. WL0024]|uniref:Dimethylsulfonioproprionate lyase family protein n=1 Tax=Albidovulum salinarum TaxID=2984153 RepID=A0ABT2X0A0_9RHOB|nr:dimethylsulfonioproprionate lyase family protein [Defluviimonas sp. WL0024]MCU9847358.1 dimethylsulfonioproprionate lyase family protein [Defluviimonas sp. WL0024]
MSARDLWPAVLAHLRGCDAPAAEFLDGLPREPQERPAPPPAGGFARPVPDELDRLADTAPAETRALCAAISAEAARLSWRSSYTTADVGAFATGYAWAPIAAPDGPLVIPSGLVCIMHIGPRLHYPPHRHEPEELYAVLAGNAVFSSDRSPRTRLGPGALRHHAPYETHSMDTDDSAALVLALWKGSYRKSEIVKTEAT